MKTFYLISLLLLVCNTGNAKVTQDAPNNSATFTEYFDEKGNKVGSLRTDAYGTGTKLNM
jgi:hypothetical protein